MISGSKTLAQQVTMLCFVPFGEIQRLQVRFGYDPSDPYAVTLTFPAVEEDVRWTMCRSLVARGMTDPAGEGDVQVWPSIDEDTGRAVMVFEFTSPDGHLVAQVRTSDVQRFLSRTLAVVPLGTESEHLDLDLVIAGLLGTGAA